ncbi:aldo/keto reductase [Pseudomonas sp. AOB-7]|uniref:aldo/keto reductase n=1 Tax=Pseudomonas sp. AOB-7 TaxID=2482750 RepID=UPI000EFBFEC1|nr:aldo/keto reductase [Pseudomonas sp. AOB-7]RMH85402.1 aldo/keto reductase [Pseudomonas sp. AOB-7]
MEYRQLGRTDLRVSALCLGTMTWGEQNSEAEGHAQIERAKACGINFMDTAEMYPVPPRAETYSRTEQIIGSYFRQRGDRADWILASKIAGPGNGIGHIRGGKLKFDRAHIVAALDASLKRLQTDWIDLYQLHWPERPTNFFGQLGYQHQEADFTPLEETLQVLDEQAKAGKIRHIGLSNETPWGTMKFLQLAESRGWPRAVSIQNPYNLLNRSFEVGLAEVACSRYVALARAHGLDPAQMALAFVTAQPFVTSNIIGATSLAQLDSNLASAELRLPEDVLAGIEAIHKAQPNPAP